MAVMQALLGFTSEGRRLRYVHTKSLESFPGLVIRSDYNKDLR